MATELASKNSNLCEEDLKMMVALRQLRTYFLNGEFRQAHNMLTDRLMQDVLNTQQLHFYNICLVYVLLKLKEFVSAKQNATNLLQKLEKESSNLSTREP